MTKKWVEPEMETLEISQTAGGLCGDGFGGHRPGKKPGHGHGHGHGHGPEFDGGWNDGFINGDYGFSE